MTEDEMVRVHHSLMDMNLSKLRQTVDRRAWRVAVRGVAKSWTQQSLNSSAHLFRSMHFSPTFYAA